MKILITNTGPWGSGSFTALDSIVDELTSRNHEVKVFFPFITDRPFNDKESQRPLDKYYIWQYPIGEGEERISGFPLLLPDPHPKNSHGQTFKQLTDKQLDYYFIELASRLHKIMNEFQPDVIECNHIWSTAYVASQLDCPTIAVSHNSDQLAYNYDKRMRCYANKAANQVNKIISISQKNKDDVIKLYGIKSEKVTCIPNSFDEKIFNKRTLDRQAVLKNIHLEHAIPNDAKIISFAGKINYNKGVDIILQANQLLEKALNIHFIMMGPGKIEDVVSENDLKKLYTDNIHYTGFVEQDIAASVHNISQLSIIPSRSEGFPMSCTEAMGCAIPVVIAKLDGAESFAVGEIIDQENPLQLAQAIEKIVNLPRQDYQKLCAQALETVKRFTWEHNIDQRLEIYQEIVQNKGGVIA